MQLFIPVLHSSTRRGNVRRSVISLSAARSPLHRLEVHVLNFASIREVRSRGQRSRRPLQRRAAYRATGGCTSYMQVEPYRVREPHTPPGRSAAGGMAHGTCSTSRSIIERPSRVRLATVAKRNIRRSAGPLRPTTESCVVELMARSSAPHPHSLLAGLAEAETT